MSKENNEKPYFLKRIIAYLVDMIFVSLLATIISMIFIDNTNYQKQSEELMELTRKYTAGEVTKEEYSKEFDNLNYYLSKESVGTSIVTCSVGIVYYVILCYFCQGITLGKYIMKMRIVSGNDKKLNMANYLIRALFVNLLLSNLVSIIFVLAMNKETFITVYPKVSNVLTIFLLATLIFMMYREDGRGLHDLISNTKVISTKEPKIKAEVKEEIVEAKVIEEKKDDVQRKKNKKNAGGKK